MKYFRLSLATGALTLVLTLPAFAGHIDTPVTSPSEDCTEAGDMSCPSLSNSVTEISLRLVQDMLSLF